MNPDVKSHLILDKSLSQRSASKMVRHFTNIPGFQASPGLTLVTAVLISAKDTDLILLFSRNVFQSIVFFLEMKCLCM